MPIANITTDYTGRSKDINIFAASPYVSGPQKITPSFGKVSSYCAGVQKLIQRYAIALLTSLGSQPAFPTFGTELTSELAVSSLNTVADLTHAFNFANDLVITRFKNYQKNKIGIPNDEQIDTAMLVDVTVSKSYEVNYRIAIYTKAGANVDFLLPIPISK